MLITQSIVLPSRASTIPDDIKPRMISYRDAMVMFKPLTASENFDDEIILNVIGKDSSIIISTPLKAPEQLPEPAEQIDIDEAEFIEPVSYDYIINSQREFDKMKGDIAGNYISSLLETSSSINIVTSDGNFLKEIYLPDDILSQNGKLITFERKATYSSTIFYAGKSVVPNRGAKLYFKNVSGVWNMPSDVSYFKVVLIFADPGKYDYTVRSQSEISKTGNDPDAVYLKSLLADHNIINIRLSDGQWAKTFYLPENNPSLSGKKLFSTLMLAIPLLYITLVVHYL